MKRKSGHDTFEEYVEAKYNRPRTEGKRTTRAPIFELLNKGTLTLKNNAQTCAPLGFPRHVTLYHVFRALVTDSFLDVLIDIHTRGDVNLLPPTMHAQEQPSSSKHRMALTYFAQRIYLTGNGTNTLEDNFPMKRWHERAMNQKFFNMFIAHFFIEDSALTLLNQAYRAHISLGRVLVIDEKLKRFTGASPNKRFVPNKKPKMGHWITEMTVVCDKTKLPYMVHQIPFRNDSDEKVTMLGIFRSCLEIVAEDKQRASSLNDIGHPPPIIVSDAYYLDGASADALTAAGVPYLCSVNPTRMASTWKQCDKALEGRELDWVIMKNASGHEIAMVEASVGKKKKNHVLTTAFNYRPGDSELNNLVSDAYGYYFNACDRYNHFLARRYWPYRRPGWENSYDDFYFSALLMNVYTLWHELCNLNRCIPWDNFTAMLAASIIEAQYPE